MWWRIRGGPDSASGSGIIRSGMQPGCDAAGRSRPRALLLRLTEAG
jgi:hypothetical protein